MTALGVLSAVLLLCLLSFLRSEPPDKAPLKAAAPNVSFDPAPDSPAPTREHVPPDAILLSSARSGPKPDSPGEERNQPLRPPAPGRADSMAPGSFAGSSSEEPTSAADLRDDPHGDPYNREKLDEYLVRQIGERTEESIRNNREQRLNAYLAQTESIGLSPAGRGEGPASAPAPGQNPYADLRSALQAAAEQGTVNPNAIDDENARRREKYLSSVISLTGR